jgi:hypothetical protein
MYCTPQWPPNRCNLPKIKRIYNSILLPVYHFTTGIPFYYLYTILLPVYHFTTGIPFYYRYTILLPLYHFFSYSTWLVQTALWTLYKTRSSKKYKCIVHCTHIMWCIAKADLIQNTKLLYCCTSDGKTTSNRNKHWNLIFRQNIHTHCFAHRNCAMYTNRTKTVIYKSSWFHTTSLV